MSKPKIFLDSSVIIAGLISETGGSAEVLRIIDQGKVLAFVSYLVLQEVEKNLGKKLPKLLPLFHKLIVNCPFEIVSDEDITPKDDKLALLVGKKSDAIIVKTAKKHKCALLTLDKAHLLKEDVRKLTKLKILTPGGFLQTK